MARTPNGRVKLNLYVQENILEGFRRLSSHKGTTYSELIREAMRHYLIKEGGKVLADTMIIRDLTK